VEILPAIDLRDGKVVRLAQGDYDRQTIYHDDPVAVAKLFVQAGAKWIHVVDLDAARTGTPSNAGAVLAVVQAVGADASVELGGGARDTAAVQRMLESGVARVVVGSAAMKDWAWFEALVARGDLAGKLALALDARDGRLAARGWTEQLETSAADLARRARGWPLGAIVYTDIARDGMLSGVNLQATAEIIRATDVPVIASGGISSLDDVRQCARIGCAGAIIGRAWYEGKIDLAEACLAAAEAL
jgi:phosphoribosylformimino-5-aminoimidazole carboxamide ribotide isomerase